jgi:hypothetical protein
MVGHGVPSRSRSREDNSIALPLLFFIKKGNKFILPVNSLIFRRFYRSVKDFFLLPIVVID